MTTPFLGHTSTRTHLKHLLDTGRFPHTLLLHGPQSIGKSTLARALAAHILAQNSNHPPNYPHEDDFPFLPNTHPVQILVNAHTHPDFFVLSSDDNKKTDAITIDATKDTLSSISMTPRQGKNMVVLIEETEKLNDSSFNALLKTLEEPKPYLTFILCSHAPGKLAPTIRSRSWMEPMFPLDDSLMRPLVRDINPPLDETILSIARGKPGLTLALTETHDIEDFLSSLDNALSPSLSPFPSLQTFSLSQNLILSIVRSYLHTKASAVLKNPSSPLSLQASVHQALEHAYSLLEDTEPPLAMPFFPSFQQALNSFRDAITS